MALVPQPLGKFNLSDASILLAVGFQAEQDIYGNMLFGYGARKVHRALNRAEAESVVRQHELDLVVVEPKLRENDGYEFIADLRRRDDPKIALVPIVVIAGHTPPSQINAARDCGAHFVIRKPVSPEVLLQRILWIAQEARPIIQCPGYVGPDRRFQNLGPPGGRGRRKDDLPLEVGEAAEPNMDQDQVDAMFNRRRGLAQ